MASETQQTVELQRSVRYGRLLIGGAILGGLVASLVTLFYPIPEGALYTMRQISGFMLLVGGVIGLLVGGAVALVLGAVAKRKRGTGVIVSHAVVEDPAEDQPESQPESQPADPADAAATDAAALAAEAPAAAEQTQAERTGALPAADTAATPDAASGEDPR